MKRTPNGWLNSRRAAAATAPGRVDVSMRRLVATMRSTSRPMRPPTTMSIQPSRTRATRRRGASHSPPTMRTKATSGRTHANVEIALIAGMICAARPSCPPTSARVTFRFAGMMSAACGTNRSSAVVTVAPRSATARTARPPPSSVRAPWNSATAGVKTLSSTGEPTSAAATASSAGSMAIRSGWASMAAVAISSPASCLTASSWRMSLAIRAKFCPFTTELFRKPTRLLKRNATMPRTSRTLDHLSLRCMSAVPPRRVRRRALCPLRRGRAPG